MRLKMKLGTVALLMLASGCATTHVSECAWVKEIRPTVNDIDVISDSLALDLQAHNEKVREFCK